MDPSAAGTETITPGRHIRYDSVPLNKLYPSMLDRVGVKIGRHGHRTGRVEMLQC